MIIAILIRAGIMLISIISTFDIGYWRFYRENSHLIFISIFIAVFIIHIISSLVIQKWLLKGEKGNLKHALWSILSPPLFLDWDLLHTKEEYQMPIPECWRRTKNSLLFHNFLTLLG